MVNKLFSERVMSLLICNETWCFRGPEPILRCWPTECNWCNSLLQKPAQHHLRHSTLMLRCDHSTLMLRCDLFPEQSIETRTFHCHLARRVRGLIYHYYTSPLHLQIICAEIHLDLSSSYPISSYHSIDTIGSPTRPSSKRRSSSNPNSPCANGENAWICKFFCRQSSSNSLCWK